MVKFYCDHCEKHREVIIEPLQRDSLNGDAVWGDIICTSCRVIIATITSDEPGIYQFVRVGPL